MDTLVTISAKIKSFMGKRIVGVINEDNQATITFSDNRQVTFTTNPFEGITGVELEHNVKETGPIEYINFYSLQDEEIYEFITSQYRLRAGRLVIKRDVLSTIKNKVFTSVTATDTEVIFKNADEVYVLKHEPECCESVYVEDIVGDLSDLENTPILLTTRESNDAEPKEEDEDYGGCAEWTFFKFATIKGYVDIRFFGESNGYYSTDANLYRYSATEYKG